MKRLLFIALLFVAFDSFSQPLNYTRIANRYRWISGMFDSALYVPRYNGTPSGVRVGENSAIDGAIAIDTANGRAYMYTGGAWVRLANYAEIPASYTAGDGLLLTGSDFKVLTKRSITIDNDSLMLVNDSTGGAYYLYGRNIANRLGFYRPDTNYIANFSTMVRPLISLTTTGSSGAATYSNVTGVLNIPQYSGGSGNTITVTGQAWVDSATGDNATARPNRPDLPFLTIDRALDSLASYTTAIVNIGLGTYDSITPAKIQRSNIWLKGSMQPITNSADTSTSQVNLVITRPTKLIRGTIIQGGVVIYDQHHIKITDLGFDSGVDWRDAGHALTDNLSITGVGTGSGLVYPPLALMEGIHIENVTCLLDTSTTLKHNITTENLLDPIIKNVLAVGGFAGVVSKNVGGHISAITSYWHGTHGIVLKANNYSPSHETVLTDFVIRSLSETDKESAGLTLQNETGLNVRTGWVISNGTIRYTKLGIRDYANADYTNVSISNITIHKPNESGVYLVGMAKSAITNVIVDTSANGHGFWIDNATGGNLITNCIAAGQTTYSGFYIDGGTINTHLFNNVATGNPQYGFGIVGATTLGEDNIATGNGTNFAGDINGVLKPYLSSAALSVVGASTTGLLQRLVIGSGLTTATGGGVDTLKTSFTIPSIGEQGTILQVSNSAATWKYDTTTLVTFSAGANFATDTTLFTTSTLYGSFYLDGNDTLIVTKIRAVMYGGSSDTLGLKISFNDTINVDGTRIKTADIAINSTTTGNETTSFDNPKIPPGNWVWMKTPVVVAGRKPYYLSVSIVGYKKRLN